MEYLPVRFVKWQAYLEYLSLFIALSLEPQSLIQSLLLLLLLQKVCLTAAHSTMIFLHVQYQNLDIHEQTQYLNQPHEVLLHQHFRLRYDHQLLPISLIMFPSKLLSKPQLLFEHALIILLNLSPPSNLNVFIQPWK